MRVSIQIYFQYYIVVGKKISGLTGSVLLTDGSETLHSTDTPKTYSDNPGQFHPGQFPKLV